MLYILKACLLFTPNTNKFTIFVFLKMKLRLSNYVLFKIFSTVGKLECKQFNSSKQA